MKSTAIHTAIPRGKLDEQVYMLVGFWVEACLYGIYCVLFFAAVHLTFKRNSREHRSAKIVFGTVTLFMFLVTSVYTAVNIYRFIEAYALGMGPKGVPIFFFWNTTIWENYVYVICSSLVIWVADILVIYRCWVIWERNYWIICLPSLLLLASIGTNIININWFLHPLSVPIATIQPILDFVYPGHLAQNIMTTGLIIHKICRQHLVSQASGVRSVSTITLFSAARLVVESAMVYTIQLTVLVVLYFLRHPAMVILQAAIVPSIGIVFVLLSVRVHMAMLDKGRLPNPSSIVLPSWVRSLDASGRNSFAVLSMLREDDDSADRILKLV